MPFEVCRNKEAPRAVDAHEHIICMPNDVRGDKDYRRANECRDCLPSGACRAGVRLAANMLLRTSPKRYLDRRVGKVTSPETKEWGWRLSTTSRSRFVG